jgi:hypothetical protein
MYLTRLERLNIVLDIAKKLKNFEGKRGEIIDLYNDQYSFITEFKKITKQYIDMDDNNVTELKGTLYFEEIDRNIDYLLPAKSYKKPLFVIRGKK